jgi:hypothetical protein
VNAFAAVLREGVSECSLSLANGERDASSYRTYYSAISLLSRFRFRTSRIGTSHNYLEVLWSPDTYCSIYIIVGWIRYLSYIFDWY